jgi:hypothetical protein
MLIRAVNPSGYMPAAVGTGLLFGLCPEGLSTGIARILLGDTGHDHSHMDHGDHGDNSHQCAIGHMLLSADAAATTDTPPATDVTLAPSPNTVVASFFAIVSHTWFYSRGPPA